MIFQIAPCVTWYSYPQEYICRSVTLLSWRKWCRGLHTDMNFHDDVIKSKHFPRYWPFVRWIHRSPVNTPHKGQWRGALMFYLIYAWINGWVNHGEVGDLRRHRAHYDVNVMFDKHVKPVKTTSALRWCRSKWVMNTPISWIAYATVTSKCKNAKISQVIFLSVYNINNLS